jgi:hypothetical protein
MADSVTTHCTRYGKDTDNPSVFITLFSHNAAEMIQTHTTELLVKDGYEPLTVSELYQFVATMLILSRIRTPTKKTYQEFSPFIEAKHKVKMMSYSPFTQICKHLRGYKISDRTGDDDADDVWVQQKNQFRQLETPEKAMFQPSDDELFSTRHSGIEGSDRKQCRLESCPSSEEEIDTDTVNSRRKCRNCEERPSLIGDIFLEDESDDSSTD